MLIISKGQLCPIFHFQVSTYRQQKKYIYIYNGIFIKKKKENLKFSVKNILKKTKDIQQWTRRKPKKRIAQSKKRTQNGVQEYCVSFRVVNGAMATRSSESELRLRFIPDPWVSGAAQAYGQIKEHWGSRFSPQLLP